ncbi:M48 family metalloprotease [Qipengyuania sp. CAU 1752]
MSFGRGLIGLATMLGLAVTAQAADGLPAGFTELRAKDARVARIGYELTTGNAAFCDAVTPATGLILHDLGAYASGTLMRASLGLSGDIGIQAVVPGSPAHHAGLGPDMTVASIAGLNLESMPLDPDKRWQRLETVRGTIAERLAEDGRIDLRVAGEDSITLEGVPACSSRFEVGPLKKRAVADGHRVVIGDEFPGHDWPDELLAGVMAHELAHNILAHRAWFDVHGRKQKWVRLTEREADRLAPWLLANAGYEPQAAVRFMQIWGPEHSGGIFRKRTHEGWDERVEHIAAEVPLVNVRISANGHADWRTHFQREPLPGID